MCFHGKADEVYWNARLMKILAGVDLDIRRQDVVIWSTPEEKQQGLQYMSPIPANKLFVFINVSPGTIFHSRNVTEPFYIEFVDQGGLMLKHAILKPPNDIIMAPPGTVYAVEAKARRKAQR